MSTATRQLKKIGSRSDVWKGIANRTSGGLRKNNLVMVDGKIKSKKQIASAKARGDKIRECFGNQDKKRQPKPKAKVEVKETPPSQAKIDALKKEMANMRKEAGRLAEGKSRVPAKATKLLKQINIKMKEMIKMKKALKKVKPKKKVTKSLIETFG